MNNDRNNDSYGNGRERQQQNPDERNWRNQERNMNPSDNDDFNNQGWPEDDDRNARSRTFNEDEDTYENEQRTANNGTPNNNWDANDFTQRTTHIHDDEQRDNRNQPYDSGSGL